MNIFLSLIAGLVFGLGLILAGMSNPAKVLGFLDLAGRWDPSLALVMAGAIALYAPAFALVRRRSASALGPPLQIPSGRRIDLRLLGGSLLFGAGWGLAGICPGPSVVLLGSVSAPALVFFATMLAGMAVFDLLEQRSTRRQAASASAVHDS